MTPQRCHPKTVASAAPAAARARAAAALVGTDGSAWAWLPLALLALVLCAALGAVLLARLRRPQLSVHSSKYRRLHSDSDSQSSGSLPESLGPWPGANGAAAGALRRRRQRVTSLLRSGGDRVRMEPLDAMPNDMAHRMVPPPGVASPLPVHVELAALESLSGKRPAAPASWGWEVDSQSLTIPAEDLQVNMGCWFALCLHHIRRTLACGLGSDMVLGCCC